MDRETKVFPGQLLNNRYKIKEEIDSSGKWAVYFGTEITTERPVTIKFRNKPIENHQIYFQYQEQFDRIKKLESPGIVKILDYGLSENHLLFVVTEYIRGKDLKTVLRDMETLSITFSCSLITQLLYTMDSVHRYGIFHKNIQPSKIILVESSEFHELAKISGFDEIELKRETDSTIEKEESFSMKKISAYYAPELLFGSDPGPYCDIYSLGVILYEMITGVLPFPSGIIAKDYKKYAPVAPPLRRVRPSLKVTRKLEKSIIKAIQWSPADRFHSAKSFLKAIQSSKSGFSPLKIAFLGIVAFAILLPIIQHSRNWIFSYINELNSTKTPVENQPIIEDKPEDLLEKFKENLAKIKQIAQKDTGYDNMVFVPGGKAVIGSQTGPKDEQPTRTVYVAPFYIDRKEVTNLEYYSFIEATKHPVPEYWEDGKYPNNMEHYPVVNVSWYDAKLYAAWRGKRLPTEVEWEKAARGPGSINNLTVENNRWPWGNEFVEGYANVENDTLMPTGQFQKGKTLDYQLFDMCGNAWEWTESWYDIYIKQDRVIRGGSFLSSHSQTTTTYRDGFFPASTREDIGFRCVKDIK